jgi:RNA polymerase sigma-B factor
MHGHMAYERPAGSLRDRYHERQLFRRYQETRDPAAREEIVKGHLGLASSVASRYSRTSVSFDDRMQLACLALVKAIDRFDPDRGVAFSSFAVPAMVGELQRYFRDHTWAVRPPRDLQERVLRLERATEALSGSCGRTPTASELADFTATSVEDVLETLEAAGARGSASLEQPLGPGEDDTLGQTIGDEDDRYRQVENAVAADDLLSELTPLERRILRLRFEGDMTQAEIGALVGCSQMQVSRAIRGALDHLSAAAADERSELLASV